jgi:hypothetical protein
MCGVFIPHRGLGAECTFATGCKMRVSLQQLSCFVVLIGLPGPALANDDYYAAFGRSEAAERVGDLGAAARALEGALRDFPKDYALSLKLAWVHFRLQDYPTAERWYRTASEVSEGSPDALIGFGWALIYQQRCEVARPVLQRVLSTMPVEPRALRALDACAPAARANGSLWLQLGGVMYDDNPWKSSSGDIAVGATFAPNTWLQLGGAYRFLALSPTDRRVAGYAQHEGYAQLGFTGERLSVLAHGAVISSADGGLSASRHIGASARLRYFGELLVELSGSFYADLWVARLAPALQMEIGDFLVTPGFALQRLTSETLGAVSLSVALAVRRWWLWISGKYGEEYRAAYLSQFAVWNSEDRSKWGASAGLRVSVTDCCAVLGSYGFNRLKSADGVASDLHSLSVGTALTL